MYYYKFKVYYDEIQDFVRDVEILATDNFESFHRILYDCIGLEGNEFAEFSICDQKWNKQKEITLTDTAEDENEIYNVPEYDEEDSYSTKSRLPKFIMKSAIIKDFITDPHQHIMYEYDFINPKIFYIELLKVARTDTAKGFPRCTYKAMKMPEPPTVDNLPSLGPDEDSCPDEDSDNSYDNEDGYNEEDFSNLNEFNDF